VEIHLLPQDTSASTLFPGCESGVEVESVKERKRFLFSFIYFIFVICIILIKDRPKGVPKGTK